MVGRKRVTKRIGTCDQQVSWAKGTEGRELLGEKEGSRAKKKKKLGLLKKRDIQYSQQWVKIKSFIDSKE